MKKVALLVLSYFILSGCALPRPPVLSIEDERSQIAADFARQGLDYFSHGRFFEAERSFRFAIVSSGRSPTLEFNLALSLEKQGSLFEATSIVDALTAAAPREPYYWAAQARLAGEQGKLIKAVQMYDKAIQVANANNQRDMLNPNFAGELFDVRSLLIAKSLLAVSTGEVEEAVCASEEAYLLSPSPGDFDRHIRTLLSLGRLQQAFDRTSSAIRTKEIQSPSLEMMRAFIFYFIQQNRCDDAVLWLERAGRSGIPEGATALDFDLSLLTCGREPRFFGKEPSLELVQAAIADRRAAKTPFGLSLPPRILSYALQLPKN